ncbi:flavoprotein [Rahnella sp. PD12R]|uniref:flavoprotein n=1 Tax=Rahnella sp. PD12R TaxID=2855688 RepID=UPI001C441934|nr:flavoprotein [Rahnella sp. PD12R]MBV6817818.1 flavoprotein [Rahnella sp. PD12R]
MESQALSRWLDTVIANLLAEKKQTVKTVRVVITGSDVTTLPVTLRGMRALEHAGYRLQVAFSHSANLGGLKAALLAEMTAGVVVDDKSADEQLADGEDYDSLYLPALSGNSLTKIALGIRDNLATSWVFHALQKQKNVIATLPPELLNPADSGFPPPLMVRLAGYADVLRQYGIAVTGINSDVQVSTEITGKKRLITLSDIRQHRTTQRLRIDSNTLITPAAQDEIRRQNITVIR